MAVSAAYLADHPRQPSPRCAKSSVSCPSRVLNFSGGQASRSHSSQRQSASSARTTMPPKRCRSAVVVNDEELDERPGSGQSPDARLRRRRPRRTAGAARGRGRAPLVR
eukprot:5490650-Prymnesium_polylepis.1